MNDIKDIKISVIMPVYNAEKYLNMAMDSLLCQTLIDIEIICVDDGSTDNSLNILEEYAEKDNRITILKQKNQYAGVARNNGMKVAKGKYLSFLDADDYFKPEMLEKAYKMAEKEQADVTVFGGEYFEGELKNAYKAPVLLNEELLPEGDSFRELDNLFTFTTGAPWNKLFLRSFVEEKKLQYHGCKRANDIYFVMLAFSHAKIIAILREQLICYRKGNSSSLQGSNSDTPKQFAYELLDIQNNLIERNLYEKYKKSVRELCLNNGIYNLRSQKSVGAYAELYEELKNGMFQQFNIVGSEEDDYYNKSAYRQYKRIMENKFSEVIGYNSELYLFPFSKVPKDSNIVLYAAGKVGQQFYRQLIHSKYCSKVVWVDKKAAEKNMNHVVVPTEQIMTECDYVVIAIENEMIATEIMEEIRKVYGVDKEKMIWEKPNM